MPIDPKLLQLLLAAKQQMEQDAVEIESTTKWCRNLDRLIDQHAMPPAWDAIVAFLRESGLEDGAGPLPRVGDAQLDRDDGAEPPRAARNHR